MIHVVAARLARAAAALAFVGSTRALAAQAVSTARDDPAAVGCWTVRTDAARADAGEALGLPAQLRIDLRGDAIAVREGIQRRASWIMDGDGMLQVTVATPSGTTWRLELRPAEGEWSGAAHALAESYGSRRGAARVTLVPGTACPKM